MKPSLLTWDIGLILRVFTHLLRRYKPSRKHLRHEMWRSSNPTWGSYRIIASSFQTCLQCLRLCTGCSGRMRNGAGRRRRRPLFNLPSNCSCHPTILSILILNLILFSPAMHLRTESEPCLLTRCPMALRGQSAMCPDRCHLQKKTTRNWREKDWRVYLESGSFSHTFLDDI